MYEGFAEIYEKHWEGYSELILPWFPVILEHFDLSPKRILDVACGTGHFALGLAEKGYDVTGTDRSEKMLSVAHRRSEENGLPVVWSQQDMQSMVWDEPFDLLTCWFDSLNYLTEEYDIQAAFRSAYESLVPGGGYLFDVNTIRGLAERWNTETSILVDTDDMFVVSDTIYEDKRHTNTMTVHAFINRGEGHERIYEEHVQRAYAIDDLHDWLEEAGFTEIRFFTRRKFAEADETSYRVFCMARAD